MGTNQVNESVEYECLPPFIGSADAGPTPPADCPTGNTL